MRSSHGVFGYALGLALAGFILALSTLTVEAAGAPPAGSGSRPGGLSPMSPVSQNQVPGPGSQAQDIREIRGPVPIPVSRWWVYPSVGGLILVLAGGILLLRRRRKPVRQPAAHEAALMELERLRPLMSPEQARAFSYEVSGVLRRYLETRFDLTPTRQTTREFLKSTADHPHRTSPGPWDDLDAFLNLCDLAKFGGWSLSRIQIEALFETARTFVDRTAPGEDAKPENAVASQKTGDLNQAPQAA